MKTLLPLFFFNLFTLLAASAGSSVEITDLMVEYQSEALGIDVQKPRFSWKMYDPNHSRGQKQTAYRIQVWDEDGVAIWDSGKVNSEVSLNIVYAGKPLQPEKHYAWQVEVWDTTAASYTSKSWFETALLSSSIASWEGAKWIGAGDTMVFYPDYLPVFKLSYKIKTKSKAAFVYGADDPRLMNPYKNLYQIKSDPGESYIAIELDITPISKGKNAVLRVFRAGYHPDDNPEIPFKIFEIPQKFINKSNFLDAHALFLSSNLGITQIFIKSESSENKIADFTINPLGAGGDFIAFPVVGSIGFKVPKKTDASFSDLTISHFRSPSNPIFSESVNELNFRDTFSETPGLKLKNGTFSIKAGKEGFFNVAKPKGSAMPMLRTTFPTKKSTVKKARLYATARGVYDVYLNGKRVNEAYFNPGSSQYNKTHFYQTFDVTSLISSGENALGAILGEGWWSGAATFSGENWNFFGDRQSFLAKLVITYEDGSSETIVTKPDTWQYYDQGPLRYGSFFQGEVYNALEQQAIEGWSTPDFNPKDWKKAKEQKLSSQSGPVWENEDYALLSQLEDPVKKLTELQAIGVEEIRPGVFIYDMGQNMVGVPHINLPEMNPGKTIMLRYAEVKYPDLPEYKGMIGMLMLENIRAAMAQDIYITKGQNDLIAPRFTFHGFRYLEITGLDKPLPLEKVKATVLSSIDALDSYYETSNPKVNKLWENITWSTYGNFLSLPTDCPQRNERLGWSGDISVFAKTASYLSNMPQFLRKHMFAMRDVQDQNGRFPDVAPTGYGFGGLLWGSAGITVAWESYLQYHDLRLLEEHYDAMKNYIRFVQKNYIDPQSNLIVQNRAWSDLGDWLAPEQSKNDKSLLWEAYFLYDLSLMQKIAAVLDKEEDQQGFNQLYDERFNLFNAVYIDPGSKETIHSSFTGKEGTVINTQTSYVLPLSFNAVKESYKSDFIANFVKSIQNESLTDEGKTAPPFSLMTGFIGTAWVNDALSDAGHTDMAYTLLQQTSYPSWLYPIEQGATTIWERLNSYTKEDGFGGNNRMNSFNHYSFGAVGAWMYTHSLGIQRDEEHPGFQHFILQPKPDPTGQMTYAKGFYNSMYGKIESDWAHSDKGTKYAFTIPANTSATLKIKGNKDSVHFSDKTGVTYIGNTSGNEVYELGSGSYEVLVTDN
ncbi:family 78 glycoside hydrolase catalytic domain [Leeuwenhoekiella sp. H156]|uniref:alpha-L-rhamnosidase n=1 Tax=Leeuwenhoekiella sp. H156 TaxID=3450128 RepID=UPI003FA436C6